MAGTYLIPPTDAARGQSEKAVHREPAQTCCQAGEGEFGLAEGPVES